MNRALYRGPSANGGTLSDPEQFIPDTEPPAQVNGKDAKSECEYASSPGARSRKGFTISLGMSMLLCFLCAFVFLGMLGRRGSVRNLRLVPTLEMYRSYRRLQADVVLDPFKGGIFGKGTVRLKELEVCEGLEDFVPCYNSSIISSDAAGAFWNPQLERQCGAFGRTKQCLIPPPADYRVPLRWPASRDFVWAGNLKFPAGGPPSVTGMNKNSLVLGDDGQIHLNYLEADTYGITKYLDDLEIYSNHTGISKILDINCGLSQRDGHVLPPNVVMICIAPYEVNGSRVQFSLERGLPAVIGSVSSRQLPFSKSSYDTIHCFECDLEWTRKDGILVLELDRILKPGGFFIETYPTSPPASLKHQQSQTKEDVASQLCWSVVTQSDQAIVWKKSENKSCYSTRGARKPSMCGILHNVSSVWYPFLRPCIVGSDFAEGIQRHQHLGPLQTSNHGFSNDELLDDSNVWLAIVKSYWSLWTPLIFSDHPKRPGEEDPLPPSNIVRNVMDMNAVHGSLNAALIAAGKSVWVMNVVPLSGPNTLPIINDRGLLGILHDWCEPFPTYSRTYDLLHAIGLLSQESQRNRCGLSSLFLEMDRILRPEGWVILRDKAELIEDARVAAGQMRWESRIVELEGLNGLQLLVCQKTFWRSQTLKSLS